MNPLTENRIVLVTRPSRLMELVQRFNTVSQARFYVEHLGADFSDYLREDETYHKALAATQLSLSQQGRVHTVERRFLPNFVFGPGDVVVTLGQDGLVANTLKYLDGQPVVGINPDPARWDGKLLPFRIDDIPRLLPEVFARRRPMKQISMARVILNNGLVMHAVNDFFIGPKSHGSARYMIEIAGESELQSSSGVIVSTGLGSTGWLKSLLTGASAVSRAAGPVFARRTKRGPMNDTTCEQELRSHVKINTEFAWDADYLFFTVREPFPTRTTSASLVFGRVSSLMPLTLTSAMAENGVIFSDGIEHDFIEFNSGTQAVVSLAERKGVLVV